MLDSYFANVSYIPNIYAALHLPQKLQGGVGNDITPELESFQFRNQFIRLSVSEMCDWERGKNWNAPLLARITCSTISY